MDKKSSALLGFAIGGAEGAGIGALLGKGKPKSMKKGGKVHKTGVYKLHVGEVVVPADKAVAAHRKYKLGHRNG